MKNDVGWLMSYSEKIIITNISDCPGVFQFSDIPKKVCIVFRIVKNFLIFSMGKTSKVYTSFKIFY